MRPGGPTRPTPRPQSAPSPLHRLSSGNVIFSKETIQDFTVAERFRILRTKLDRLEGGDAPWSAAEARSRAIMVTSAIPGEGKSFVSSNLARAFAATRGARVLLIDCDLRKPNIHRFFHSTLAPGMGELLLGRARLFQAIRPTSHGVDIIPAGSFHPELLSLLEGGRLASLFHELRKNYTHIIVDTPPCLLCHEPMKIAPLCDGVLMVARTWHTDKNYVQDAVQTIGPARILGLVANDCDDARRNYSKYEYYYQPRSDEEGNELPHEPSTSWIEWLGEKTLSLLAKLPRPRRKRKASAASGK